MINPPFNNETDQETRRQILKDTLLSRAQADAEIEAQGRFKRHTPTTVTGAAPTYPKLPSGNPWATPDPSGKELPLGYDINALPELGGASAPASLPCEALETASSPGDGLSSTLRDNPSSLSRRRSL